MKIIKSIDDMMQLIQKNKDKTIGFVPTMGFLHEGHLSLVHEARQENELIVMSIFVNPLQFGPNEDFETYPRDMKRDEQLAKNAGVHVLFYPETTDMYPVPLSIQMAIQNEQTNVLCGKSRQGHFEGVITVLTKLFHIIHPTKAYFGLKDAQQYAVVQTLINDLNFPIQLVGLPTVREHDGLAKSSRNVHLTDSERESATSLYKALKHGQKLIVDGINNPATIIKEVKKIIENNATNKIDYVELLSYPSLTKIDHVKGQVIIAVAVYFNEARLIDNLIVNEGKIVRRLN